MGTTIERRQDGQHVQRVIQETTIHLMVVVFVISTYCRAKELRKVADHVITLGKKRTPAAKIDLEGILRTPLQVHKVHAYPIIWLHK